jgi:hypothetical protein
VHEQVFKTVEIAVYHQPMKIMIKRQIANFLTLFLFAVACAPIPMRPAQMMKIFREEIY